MRHEQPRCLHHNHHRPALQFTIAHEPTKGCGAESAEPVRNHWWHPQHTHSPPEQTNHAQARKPMCGWRTGGGVREKAKREKTIKREGPALRQEKNTNNTYCCSLQNTEEPGRVTLGSVPAGFTDHRLTSILSIREQRRARSTPATSTRRGAVRDGLVSSRDSPRVCHQNTSEALGAMYIHGDMQAVGNVLKVVRRDVDPQNTSKQSKNDPRSVSLPLPLPPY